MATVALRMQFEKGGTTKDMQGASLLSRSLGIRQIWTESKGEGIYLFAR